MTPWDEAQGYVNGHISAGAGGGLVSCANTNTGNVWWRFDNGTGTWSTVIQVGTVTTGGKACHTWYDGKYVWVTNGTTTIFRSTDYGKTWESI